MLGEHVAKVADRVVDRPAVLVARALDDLGLTPTSTARSTPTRSRRPSPEARPALRTIRTRSESASSCPSRPSPTYTVGRWSLVAASPRN